MVNEKKEPPKSAEELLERYAAGERDFFGTELAGLNYKRANLYSANLAEAKFAEAHLEGAQLAGASLRHSQLSGADLYRANLRDADLEGAILYSANLKGAHLVEAILRHAKLQSANLAGANLYRACLEGANLAGARLEGARLEGANLYRANLAGANLEDADLIRANLSSVDFLSADLRDARLKGANLEGAKLNKTAFNHDTDLLTANWQTLRFGDKTYHRDAVERGEEILPVGMGPRLAILIETARLNGAKTEAASAVVDYLANAGIEAKVENVGGDGSVIRLSVCSRDNAEILLQAGDGVCRLLGLGSGVENLLPSNSSLTAQAADAIAPLLDERFDLARRQAHLETDEILTTLETIGREDLRSVKLAGFTDAQMEALKNLSELGNEYLEVKVDEENKEAWMTPGQQVARDVYELQVAKPLRTIIAAVFQSLAERPGDG